MSYIGDAVVERLLAWVIPVGMVSWAVLSHLPKPLYSLPATPAGAGWPYRKRRPLFRRSLLL